MRFQYYFISKYCESYINYLKRCPGLNEEVFREIKGQFSKNFRVYGLDLRPRMEE